MGRFPAPPEALEEHTAIIGKTGAGKTYTAKGFAEDLLHEGSRFCVIDPTGVWWGLKSSSDGEREGFPVVVFGGDHGDVPLREEDAEAVAEIVATTATPCVLDVSAFPSLAAQKRFMADFAEHVFRLNKEALHLFVDEADAFMPQRPGPDENVMLGRWDTIARRGRSRGFRLTLITQRPAVLNKNALSQVGTLIALKLTSPQDRKAVGDWIEGNADKAAGKEVLASLPALDRGEGWVWSPGHDVLERVRFSAIETWDSSRTPGKGEIHREASTLARADVAGILAKLSTPHRQAPGSVSLVPDRDLLEAAERKGYDRGIADAARSLTDATTAARNAAGALEAIAEAARSARVEILKACPAAGLGGGSAGAELSDFLARAAGMPGLKSIEINGRPYDWRTPELEAAAMEAGALDFSSTGDGFLRINRIPLAGMVELQRRGAEILERQFDPGDPGHVSLTIRACRDFRAAQGTSGAFEGDAPAETESAPRALSAAGERILGALEDAGKPLTRRQLGTLAKMAPQGGAFASAIKALREAGLIEVAGTISLTPQGHEAAGPFIRAWGSPLAMWHASIDDVAGRRILEALAETGGKATRANLAALAGYAASGGAFSSGLKILRDNGLLTTVRENGIALEFSEVAAEAAAIARG